jgi:hypothetical protein
MADNVMRGKVLGQSISEILPSGYASYTGIEFERDDGEVVWLRNVSMGSRCHYLFEAAMEDGEPVTLWTMGNARKSWVYGVTLGKRYAYEPPPAGPVLALAVVGIVVGALSAFFLIGIPILLGGLYMLVRGLTLHPRYRERDVRAGTVPDKPNGWGVAALAEARAKDGA